LVWPCSFAVVAGAVRGRLACGYQEGRLAAAPWDKGQPPGASIVGPFNPLDAARPARRHNRETAGSPAGGADLFGYLGLDEIGHQPRHALAQHAGVLRSHQLVDELGYLRHAANTAQETIDVAVRRAETTAYRREPTARRGRSRRAALSRASSTPR